MPNNSILVPDYLTKMGIKTALHPLYSPDLAPCDFWYFPKLQEKLRGCRYEIIEETKEAVTKLLVRYNECIAAGGDYFEGYKSFLCVLSIKVLIRKRLETYLMILVPHYLKYIFNFLFLSMII